MISDSHILLQYQGIELGGLLSDFKKDSDPIFAQLMKQLSTSKSTEVRKRIIRVIKAPYSVGALAFLGKRIKDANPDVSVLVFRQLLANNTEITAFSSKEARMLVITEGITSPHQEVRLACIEFLKPTILAKPDDLSYIFKLIDTRLAFTNQYFARVPSLLIIAILEILPHEIDLAHYLGAIIDKLRSLASTQNRQSDIEMISGKQEEPAKPP